VQNPHGDIDGQNIAANASLGFQIDGISQGHFGWD
jgi:hypothetical protein